MTATARSSASASLGPGSPASDRVAAERLSLLLESTGEGIFGVDNAGCCTFINRAGATMLGRRPDDVLGCNMHALIHHSHPDGRHYPERDCPIFNAFREGLACRIDREVLWRADGSSFFAEYSSHPMVEGGVVLGAVVTFVDITERRLGEQLLQQAQGELEARVAARTAELSAALGQLRDLSAYLATVREEERTRIARDIHDELGSLLVALKMDVNWLGARVADRPALQEKCAAMTASVGTAVDKVGRIITDLRPSLLDHQGLWAALEWQAGDFAEKAELACRLRFHVEAGAEVPSGVAGERWATAVFRIFQEMLSNVGRHARATTLGVSLYVDGPPEPELHLEVLDDGVGAPAEALARADSYGVMGMRERAGHFGGRVEFDAAPGGGTRVRLRMPWPEAGPPGGARPR